MLGCTNNNTFLKFRSLTGILLMLLVSCTFAQERTAKKNAPLGHSAPMLTANDGHTSNVWAIAISPNRQFLATTDGSTTKIIHRPSQRVVRTLCENCSFPFWLNNQQLLVISRKKDRMGITSSYIERLDIETNEREYQFKLSENLYRSANWAKCDEEVTLIASTGKQLIEVWSVMKKINISRFPFDSMRLGGENSAEVAISRCGDLISYADEFYGGDLTLRGTKNEEYKVFPTKHLGGTSHISFSPDGKLLATSHGNGLLRIWNTLDGSIVLEYTDKGDPKNEFSDRGDISALVFDATGRNLYFGGRSKTVFKLDLSLRSVTEFSGSASSIESMALTDSDRTLLVGEANGSVGEWDISLETKRLEFRGINLKLTSVLFAANSGLLVVGGDHSSIGAWALRSPDDTKLHRIKGSRVYAANALVQSVATQTLLAGLGESDIEVYSSGTMDLIETIPWRRSRWSESVAISPDGMLAAAISGKEGNDVAIFPLRGNPFNIQEASLPTLGFDNVKSIKFHPDGKRIARSDRKSRLRLDFIDASKEGIEFQGVSGNIHSITFDKDGRHIFGGSDKDIHVWDINSGTPVTKLMGHTGWISAIALSDDQSTLASASWDGTVRLWDWRNGKEVARFDHYSPHLLKGITFIGGSFVAAVGPTGTKIWDIKNRKHVADLRMFTDGSWAVTEPGGRYDSSNNGENPNLHWVVGMTPIGIEQLKERYYDPGLLSKIMGFNKEPLRTVPSFEAAAVKLPPSVTLSQPPASPTASSTSILARIQDEGGGIGRVRVRLNGKEMVADASAQLSTSADVKARELNITLPVDRLLTGVNTVDVMAFNADNHIQSRHASINLQGPAAVARTTKPVSGFASISATAVEVTDAVPPTLYVIAVGVSKYAAEGGRLNLAFSGKDAVDLSQSLLIAGKRLFGAGQVNVRVLSDADATVLQAAAKAGHTVAVQAPGRTQVAQAFADVAKEAKANDIVVVFLGGHGVMTPGIGLDTGDYHYLMPEARSADLTDPAVRKLWAVSSAELTEWTKAIKANKQVLVLDTCAAGGAVDKLVQQRALPGSHTIALERLKDRTGFHILAGSAADKVSYEASRYGQGLLTYALLAGLRGAALRDGEYADVSKLFQYAVDQVPELAKGIGGIQKPMVASPRGSSFDIGRLVDEDKRQVPVAKIMPLMLRSQIQSDDFKDTLRLEARLNARLREFNYSGAKGELMFVDADEHPDGWKLRARYRKVGEGYVLEGVIFQGEQVRGRVKVELESDEAGQVERLITTLKTEIKV